MVRVLMITVVSHNATTYNTTTTPKTLTGLSWLVDDVIVLKAGSGNDGGTLDAPTNANLVFAQRQLQDNNSPGGIEANAGIWTAKATSDQTAQTISQTYTTGFATGWGFEVTILRGAGNYRGGFANNNESVTSYTPLAGSAMFLMIVDWDTVGSGYTGTIASGTLVERTDAAFTDLSVWTADWLGVTNTAQSWGITDYTGQTDTQVGVEITVDINAPIVVSTAETAVTTAGTSHVITLPAGIVATDLVLIIMDIGSTSATLNALTDWTEDLDEAAANGLKILRYTGAGVPGNPTFTSSASTRSASIAYRISGADKTIAPQIATTATGTSATPDPPASATPAGSIAKDFLVIAFAGMAGEEADDDTWGNTPPTNYVPSPPLQIACGTVGTNLGGLILAAHRRLNTGVAENPGTFGVDVSAAWRAQTILIHPIPPVLPANQYLGRQAVRRAANF